MVICGTLFALYHPNLAKDIFPTFWVTCMLGIIMFGMGLTVKIDDFKEFLIRPKFVIVGISLL